MPASPVNPNETRRLIRRALPDLVRLASTLDGAPDERWRAALARLMRAAFFARAGRLDLLAGVDRSVAEYLGTCEVEQLGGLYEGLRDLNDRRAAAAFYTPARLSEPLVRHALEPLAYDGPREGLARRRWRLRSAEELLSLRICDPAVGSGAFLVKACRYLSERLLEAWGERPPWDKSPAALARGLVARHCLFGVDCDALAVEITRLSLWLLAGAEAEPASYLEGAIRCGDSLSLAWPEAFSGVMAQGGFDALLCNPPFGNAIRDLSPQTKAGLRGRFVGLSGTADLSYYFLALTEQLARTGGVTGIILPRAFLTAPAARSLRRSLLAARPPALIWCPDGGRYFADANVRVVAVVLGGRRGCRGGVSGPLREIVVAGENWWAPLGEVVGPICNRPSSVGPICNRPSSGEKDEEADYKSAPQESVADRFDVMASMTTAMAYDLLPYLADQEHGDGLPFVTAGLIDPHSCSWGRKRCRYLGRLFVHPRVTLGANAPPALRKRLSVIRRPKLLVAAAAGPGDRVEAFFDRSGERCGAVSTLTILDRDDDAGRLQALCAWLNGDEVARRLREELGASAMGSGLLTVSKSFLARLPLPR